MADRDREEAMAKYNRMFDEAEDETALLERLGSPTMAAISVLRGYIPSKNPTPDAEVSSRPETDFEPEAPKGENPSVDSPEAQAGSGGLVEPEPMPENITDEPVHKPAAEPEKQHEILEYFRDTPRPEPVPSDIVTEEVQEEAPAPDEHSAPEPDFAPTEVSKPRAIGLRLVLFILFGTVVCVPAAFVLIAVDLAILFVGAGLAAAGVFTISLGFVGITVFADFMLLFGAGLSITALGLPIIYFAVWFFARVVVGFINLVLRTGGKWCYKHTEEVSAE